MNLINAEAPISCETCGYTYEDYYLRDHCSITHECVSAVRSGEKHEECPFMNNVTNGAVIKAILNPREDQIKITGDWVEIEMQREGINFSCSIEYWNSPYKKEF